MGSEDEGKIEEKALMYRGKVSRISHYSKRNGRDGGFYFHLDVCDSIKCGSENVPLLAYLAIGMF